MNTVIKKLTGIKVSILLSDPLKLPVKRIDYNANPYTRVFDIVNDLHRITLTSVDSFAKPFEQQDIGV